MNRSRRAPRADSRTRSGAACRTDRPAHTKADDLDAGGKPPNRYSGFLRRSSGKGA